MNDETDATRSRTRDGRSREVRTIAGVALALLLAAQPAGAAQGGDRTGKEVVEAGCIACHGSGVNDAPRIGDQKAWTVRAERGLSGLTQNAIAGIRKMPPHGGNPGLSDTELERAITYMVNASGLNWAEPVSRTAPAMDRNGEQVVQTQCSKCHEVGLGGAPKVGDRAAWIPRLRQGFDVLVRSAINGHGGMPPRGGMANLTDNEIRSAIAYMLNPVAAGATPIATAAMIADANHRLIEGTEIFFGVTPAETLRGQHPGPDAESVMHGKIPSGKDYYHVNVSLFDSQTRSPITDADVDVTIADPVRGRQVTALDLMVLGNTLSYGNYIRLPSKNAYTIDVSIRRVGAARPITTAFAFQK